MFQQHIITIKSTLAQAIEKKPVTELASQLFQIFFAKHPEAEQYFADYDMAELGPRKLRILTDHLLDTLEYPDFAEGRIDEEVFRHLIHSLRDREYYFAMIDALIECIKTTLASEWNRDIETHWIEASAGMKHMVDLGAKKHFS